jgi:hypothetical protein
MKNLCNTKICKNYNTDLVNNCQRFDNINFCEDATDIIKTSKTISITENASALDTQVGGDHYKKYGDLQPIEVAMKFNYNALQYKIFKYITRYKDKNGLEDLMKIKNCVDLLVEIEYGTKKSR